MSIFYVSISIGLHGNLNQYLLATGAPLKPWKLKWKLPYNLAMLLTSYACYHYLLEIVWARSGMRRNSVDSCVPIGIFIHVS